jgi:hypothetical protein
VPAFQAPALDHAGDDLLFVFGEIKRREVSIPKQRPGQAKGRRGAGLVQIHVRMLSALYQSSTLDLLRDKTHVLPGEWLRVIVFHLTP